MSQIVPFKNQIYEELKNQHNRHNLFEDSLFPPNDESLYYSSQRPSCIPQTGITWKRISDVIKDPIFKADFFEICTDLDQGFMGVDSLFITNCIYIMRKKELFAKIVPQEQTFDGENYGGVFHFRFWSHGWVDVVVDDYLPFYENNQLVFCQDTKKRTEFWFPLLEKAYAKFYGSYEALDMSWKSNLRDMCGGITESWNLKSFNECEKENFWSILCQAYLKKSIITCLDPEVESELTGRYAFPIIDLIEFELDGDITSLIRFGKPWGHYSGVWLGAWSTNSNELKSLEHGIKEENNLNIDHNSEDFLMSYEDFIKTWNKVMMVHINRDSYNSIDSEDSQLPWIETAFHGEWKSGNSNPQFLIKLENLDKDEDLATIIIGLMQKEAKNLESIQFKLYKIKENVELKSNEKYDLNKLEFIDQSESLRDIEIIKRFRLLRGNYLIIPSLENLMNRRFLLRIFSESEIISSYVHCVSNAENPTGADLQTEEKVTETKVRAPLEVKHFKNQVFENLKINHSRQNLFKDDLFPPEIKSLHYSKNPPEYFIKHNIVWKRASEVVKNADFGVLEASSLDHGLTTNSSFFASLLCLINSQLKGNFLSNVIPPNQNFDKDYAGIFHFRFFLMGFWTDVVIDDYLPFNEDNKLVFAQNNLNSNQLWIALLEKAFAKFHGSYETIYSGNPADFMIDMTGGLYEIKNWIAKDYFEPCWNVDPLWNILNKSFDKKSLIISLKAENSSGLNLEDAYQISNIKNFEYKNNQKEILIQILKPWSKKSTTWKNEFNIVWNNDSPEWQYEYVSSNASSNKDKQTEGLWMRIQDFIGFFNTVFIFSLASNENNKSWITSSIYGEWNIGDSLGGLDFKENFWINPQVFISIPGQNTDLHTVIISLTQSESSAEQKNHFKNIAWKIFKIRDDIEIKSNEKRSRTRFYANQLEYKFYHPACSLRDITGRTQVMSGHYVIIPCIDDVGINSSFLMRIFTETLVESCLLTSHKIELTNEEKSTNFQSSKESVPSLTISKMHTDNEVPTSLVCSLM